jgi:hypothetical protein
MLLHLSLQLEVINATTGWRVSHFAVLHLEERNNPDGKGRALVTSGWQKYTQG